MLQDFFTHASWLHIAVAGVVYFMLGALWYSKALFGNVWAAGHNIVVTEEAKKRMPMMMIMTLLGCLAMTVAIGLAMYVMQAPGTCMNGIKTGLFLSGAFAAIPMGINYLYLGKAFKLWIIDAGYHVIGMTLASIIMSVWH